MMVYWDVILLYVKEHIYSPTLQRISDQEQCTKMAEAYNTVDIIQPCLRRLETEDGRMRGKPALQN